jgi:cytochrome c-type biogenesis protein CcmH
MSGFLIACVLLVLLSGIFYLIPRSRRRLADTDQKRANLEWFKQRQQELEATGEVDLVEDTRLRLLEDEQGDASDEALAAEPGNSFPRWVLLLVVATASAGFYFKLGSAQDVLISRELQNLGDDSSPEQMRALMLDIEARSAQRPENLHYVAMLGRYYMGQQQYDLAAQTYGELSVAAPEDAQALAYAAQASYLAAGRQLDDRARMQAEQALAINPHQRTALGLLGMASYEQGLYRAAIEYWQRLIAMEPPGSETTQMIGGIIAMAQEKLGETPAAPAEPVPEAVGAGVTVAVTMPEGAAVGSGDTVFVLARNAESESRMPIAVQRLQGSQLPITLRLDDSKSMAGQKLSETASVLVIVQVSPSGQPGEANATWLGQAGPMAPTEGLEPVEIVLVPAS